MRCILTIITMWCCATVFAQHHIIYSNDIASLSVTAGMRWQDFPIIKLNGNESINIDFDELSHTYRRLTYNIKHLESDFTESDGLFTSDYLIGFQDGLTIDDYEQSINTVQDYTHYKLQIPNRYCRLSMSGNYRLDITDDDNNDELLLSVFFMVNEDKANVSLNYTTDTDIDTRKSHQQVELTIDYSKLGATNPDTQIKGYVLQNNRWDNAITLPQVSRINQQYMEWTHCRDLIFDAGNEYHKFEILDVHLNSMNVETNYWDGEEWHTQLWPDYERHSYVYDETANGAFYIRNSDNSEKDITSEYVNVHFYLKTKEQRYPVFVNGMWTNDKERGKYMMTYNNAAQRYELTIPLKYGYYSYQYVCIDDNGKTEIPTSEGSFYETRNKYNALIYFKGNTDRADRLVGCR